MTQEEFQLLAKGLKAAYPSPNFLPDDYSMKVWFRLLKDIDYALAEAAAYKHICSSKFPPSIAELREQSENCKTADTRNWLSGWSLVQKAIGRYGMFRPVEALDSIREQDPLAAAVAQRMGWRLLCESQDVTADRANFRQSYETIQNRSREDAKLPANLRNRVQSLAAGFLMEAEARAGLPPKSLSQSF